MFPALVQNLNHFMELPISIYLIIKDAVSTQEISLTPLFFKKKSEIVRG